MHVTPGAVLHEIRQLRQALHKAENGFLVFIFISFLATIMPNNRLHRQQIAGGMSVNCTPPCDRLIKDTRQNMDTAQEQQALDRLAPRMGLVPLWQILDSPLSLSQVTDLLLSESTAVPP